MKDRELHHREGLLLELVAEDGVTGLGEASPLPRFSPETTGQAARQLVSLALFLLERNLAEDGATLSDALVRELESLDAAPSVRFGIELALWNLQAESEGKSLPEALCSSRVASVPVNGLLDGTVEEVLVEGRRMREAGYEAVKLKVGGCGVEEVSLVRNLAEVLGDGTALRLDANRAWSFAEAAAFARAVADVRYEYIEEPLADPSGLADLVRETGVPVALDESLVGMAPEDLVEHDYARAVVIKPTLVGGISRTLRLAKEARGLGIMPVISSAYETGVGTEALLALSAATGSGEISAGLDTYRRLGADVVHPTLNVASPRVDLREESTASRSLCRRYLKVYSSSEG
ncbi:MAG: o-succinylbenzoate synthase [Actinomycetota bacterium]|nr:o-succinylbenzoate synthase [Actinomycetota bacterium]